MKAQSSRLMLRLSIYVTSAAILSILINLLANVFSNKSLNSTGYYIVVIALGAASIVFGILQVWPRFSAFRRTDDEQQTPSVLLESDTYGEKLAIHNLVSDIVQQAYPDLVSVLNRYYDRQQETISILFEKITNEVKEITQQNQMMLSQNVRNQQLEDARNQELNNLVQALEANAQYLSACRKDFGIVTQDLRAIAQHQQILLKEREVKTQQQSYSIRITMEIDGVPITIETSDAEKATDIASAIKQYTQATSSLSSEKKRQPSIFVKENTEPYKTESNPE